MCGSKTTLTSSKGHRASLRQLQNHLPKHRISTSKPLIATLLVPNKFIPPTPILKLLYTTSFLDAEHAALCWGTVIAAERPERCKLTPRQVPAPASTLLTRARSTCRRVMSWPEQTGDVMARAARRHPLSNLSLPPAWQSCSLSSHPPGTRGPWHSPILIPPLVGGGGRGAGAYTGCCQDFSRQAK